MSKGLTPRAVPPDFTLPGYLPDLLRRITGDFDPASEQARAAWNASMPSGAVVAGHA